MALFCISSKNNHIEKVTQKNSKKHLTSKNTIKTNEMSTFASLGLDLGTTPDSQNHHKAPPEPCPDTLREPSVFSVPFGPSPRTPWGLLRTP